MLSDIQYVGPKYTHLFVVHCSYTVMSRFSVKEENESHPFTLASVFILNDCNPEISDS